MSIIINIFCDQESLSADTDTRFFLLIPVQPHQLVLAEHVTTTHQAVDFFLKIAVSSLSMRTNLFCQEAPNSFHTTGKFAEQTLFPPSHLCFEKWGKERYKSANSCKVSLEGWKSKLNSVIPHLVYVRYVFEFIFRSLGRCASSSHTKAGSDWKFVYFLAKWEEMEGRKSLWEVVF